MIRWPGPASWLATRLPCPWVSSGALGGEPCRTEIADAIPMLLALAASPTQWLDRGPNMMMAMPSRLTATPTQSVVVGLTLSTSISQTMATPM